MVRKYYGLIVNLDNCFYVEVRNTLVSKILSTLNDSAAALCLIYGKLLRLFLLVIPSSKEADTTAASNKERH